MDEAFADRRGLLESCQWRVLLEPMDGFGKITRELVFETKATERRMLSKETAAKEPTTQDCARARRARREPKKDKLAAYRDAATNVDLTDVHAVENRFAADAEKKLDEDADDGNDNKELDESMKEEFETESVKNLDIRTNDKGAEAIAAEPPFVFCCKVSEELAATRRSTKVIREVWAYLGAHCDILYNSRLSVENQIKMKRNLEVIVR
ncbi:unnamed protein product [Peronospora effusa]|nr:unnamed protein product [Peronospora effusa]